MEKPAVPGVILVEGPSDRALLTAIRNHAGVDGGVLDIKIPREDAGRGGIFAIDRTTITVALKDLARRHESFAFGLVVDADKVTPAERFRNNVNKLRSVSDELPLPTENGEVTNVKPVALDGITALCNIRTGILVLPTDQPGDHEKLIWRYITDTIVGLPDVLTTCYNEVLCVDKVPDPATLPDRVKTSREKREKILVHMAGAVGIVSGPTPLAADRHLYQTYGSRFWDWTNPVFEPLVGFIRQLTS